MKSTNTVLKQETINYINSLVPINNVDLFQSNQISSYALKEKDVNGRFIVKYNPQLVTPDMIDYIIAHEWYHVYQDILGFPAILYGINDDEHKLIAALVNSFVLDINVDYNLKEHNLSMPKYKYEKFLSKLLNSNFETIYNNQNISRIYYSTKIATLYFNIPDISDLLNKLKNNDSIYSDVIFLIETIEKFKCDTKESCYSAMKSIIDNILYTFSDKFGYVISSSN